MDSDPLNRRTRPRTGLVLGAGGVLGAAWMTGALAVLQEQLPRPLADADVMVGTSAGSVLAVALRCGFTTDQLVAHQRGFASGPLARLGPPDLGCGALPPCPRPGVGSPRLLLTALRAPRRVPALVAASACLPRGRADHDWLRALVDGMADAAAADGHSLDAGGKRTWIVAVDYDSGRRVVFGRSGAPRASLADMVAASCSVPAWFEPVEIGGHCYVDGGVRSAASADLLATAGLDEAYVLAPLASMATDRPRNPLERVERRLRRAMTNRVMAEVGRLQAGGTRVTVLTPGPEDLAAMGANLMDGSRRQAVLETSLRTSARFYPATDPARGRPGRAHDVAA